MKKIIVFGASGDTGLCFLEYFKERDKQHEFEIIAVGTRALKDFKGKGVTYYQVDITQAQSFDVLPKDVYAVVHLAGMMPARMSGYNPQLYVDVNITGTLNILNFCKDNHVDRILFAQSFGDVKDYGEKHLVIPPDAPRKFSMTSDHSIYVMSKNFAVDAIENYHQQYGLKRFIFRLPTIYLYSSVDTFFVDGEKRKIGYRFLIDKAIKGEQMEVWGDASRKKDMVYVKDFCQMLYAALFVDRTEGYYNVGTGVGTSLLDQIKGIAEVFNPVDKKSEIIMKPEARNAPQYIMDITSAKEELGYEPKYLYQDMLLDFKREMEKAKE